MPEPIPEWRMITELFKIHDELPEQAEDFVIRLHEQIDPYESFRDQLIGLPESVDKQEKWLRSLYARHVDYDEDEAQEIWDEE